MEMSGEFRAPAALTPWERASGPHLVGGWVRTNELYMNMTQSHDQQ